jgi:hypothetical protein
LRCRFLSHSSIPLSRLRCHLSDSRAEFICTWAISGRARARNVLKYSTRIVPAEPCRSLVVGQFPIIGMWPGADADQKASFREDDLSRPDQQSATQNYTPSLTRHLRSWGNQSSPSSVAWWPCHFRQCIEFPRGASLSVLEC